MNLCDYGCCPREVLDLFCGAGGAAEGLHRAWPHAHIVGVDIKPQKHYPFDFVLGDALEAPLDGDFYWASPPCQGYSVMRHLPWLKDKEWPLLIEPVRARLMGQPARWVMENVAGAPLRSGITLCGQTFGLRIYRHRWFESSELLLAPAHLPHRRVIAPGRSLNDRKYRPSNGMESFPGAATKGRRAAWDAGGFASVTGDIGTYMGPEAMGIDWMTGDELSQAIPPAYSQFIATQLTPALREVAA